MSALCFYFQVHQPYRLRHYTFFDIGVDSFYEDEDANCGIMLKVARKCYLPMNALLLKLIRKYDGRFKVSFSISGTALDQFEAYAPEVIQSFRELVATGCVELLSETYNHSLAFLYSPEEFREPGRPARRADRSALRRNAPCLPQYGTYLQQRSGRGPWKRWATRPCLPRVRITCSAGAAQDFVYRPAGVRSPQASAQELPPLGRHRLPVLEPPMARISAHGGPSFPSGRTPPTPPGISSICSWITRRSGSINGNPPVFSPLWKPCPRSCCGRPVSRSSRLRKRRPGSSRWRALDVPHFMSWADAERDLTAWLGNDMQNDAIESVYRLEKAVKATGDPGVLRTWRRLQTSDHFYYMSTKWFSDGDVHSYFNPYGTPYDAYINYMNVLADFRLTLDAASPLDPGTKSAVLESA